MSYSATNSCKVLFQMKRGFLYCEPENSIEGFSAAEEVGCDAVELDVFLLKDGNLVVFHGEGTDENPGWLNSYCGIEGNILGMF